MRNKKMKLGGMMFAGMIIVISFVYAINVQPVVFGETSWFSSSFKLNQFDSYKDFTDFLYKNAVRYKSYYGEPLRGSGDVFIDGLDLESINLAKSSSPPQYWGGEIVDYSQTNVQVAGVDEPDVVKTDGKYLYIVSENKVIIVKATPAEDAEIITEVFIDDSLNIRNIFICGNRLVIFAEDYSYLIYENTKIVEDEGETLPLTQWYYSPDIHIKIFDLKDLNNFELVKDVVVAGHYTGARLIKDFIYLITTQYSYDIVNLDENEVIVPKILINGKVREIPLDDIYYTEIPEESSYITNIVSVNVKDDSEDVTSKIFLLGNTQILYVSLDNIYVAYSSYYYDYEYLEEVLEDVLFPMLPDSIKSEISIVKTLSISDYQKKIVSKWILEEYIDLIDDETKLELAKEINKKIEKTVIHRISISNGNIEYKAQGEIPGSVKNQFSLSEYEDFLRVSSTMQSQLIREFFPKISSQNNIYILNMDLEIVGSIEGLAPGERIYATRFLGDTCYLVTFRQIDPFFVIDLSNPSSPNVLGELKIPGYSTYLHPYDDNHVIGIGMDNGRVKVSFYDVTDMSNPIELSKYEINNDYNYRGTSSALNEHKAFLFDKEKNLLIIPSGSYSKQSAYVFDITVYDGIELIGSISHDSNTIETQDEDYYYWKYDYDYSINRCLYIENVLYTFSDKMVKMNSIDDLSEINIIYLD